MGSPPRSRSRSTVRAAPTRTSAPSSAWRRSSRSRPRSRVVPVAKRGMALATASTSHNLTLVILPPLSVVVLDRAGLNGVAILAAVMVVTALALAFARPFNPRETGQDAELHHARRVLGFAFRRAWTSP